MPEADAAASPAPVLTLDAQTAERVALLAVIRDTSPADVVRRLLSHLAASQGVSPAPGVAIYALYANTRIEATFHPSTSHVTIPDGPAQGT
ncbi:hypothetical protein [Streptomyces goshikiensis]|uniref:hypothetical protein n=1 Tax=Streptomyces goshikiensis TaxID=1942 RepID=UPI00331692DF